MTEKFRLVHVLYRDHVRFRNTDPTDLKPCIREVVGWLIRESDEALYLCHNRAVNRLFFEKPSESGFIILKSDVLEKKELD